MKQRTAWALAGAAALVLAGGGADARTARKRAPAPADGPALSAGGGDGGVISLRVEAPAGSAYLLLAGPDEWTPAALLRAGAIGGSGAELVTVLPSGLADVSDELFLFLLLEEPDGHSPAGAPAGPAAFVLSLRARPGAGGPGLTWLGGGESAPNPESGALDPGAESRCLDCAVWTIVQCWRDEAGLEYRILEDEEGNQQMVILNPAGGEPLLSEPVAEHTSGDPEVWKVVDDAGNEHAISGSSDGNGSYTFTNLSTGASSTKPLVGCP